MNVQRRASSGADANTVSSPRIIYPGLTVLTPKPTEVRIIYLQRKEFRLFPEGADQSGPTAHAAQSPARLSAELSEVLRTEVG
jgi:hypothetical protein